jgi:hypothetical protein
MELTEALSTDISITTEDVQRARLAAEEAAGVADRLDSLAVADTAITAAQVAEAHADAELAARRADHVAAQAQRAAQARRLLALAELGGRVDHAAVDAEDATPAAIGAAVREVRQAVAHLRQVLGEHDATVQALAEEATRLGAEPVGPLGPMPNSAHVAVGDATVRHEQTSLQMIGLHADEAIAHAVAGDMDAARAVLVPVIRQHRLFVAPTGTVHTFGTPLHSGVADQVRRGELVELPADVAEQYQLGRITAGHVKAFAEPLIARRRADYFNEFNRPGRVGRGSIIEPATFGG